MDLQQFQETALTYLHDYGLNVLFALAVFFIGKWLARKATNIIKRAMAKTKMDPMLESFLGHIIYGLLIAVVVISALGQVGVQTTSLVALLATAGLAVGLALKDSLSNFAAGVMMIIFRPFNVGDYVETEGGAGIVESIGIFTTYLRTPDSRSTIVPNNSIMTGTITNYSAKPTRRIDLVFGCGYGDDLKKAKEVLKQCVEADDRILKDPEPTIAVSELADSSVNFVVRPWVNTSDYWPVRFDLIERVKLAFDENGVSIPFPQRDVHIYNEKAED